MPTEDEVREYRAEAFARDVENMREEIRRLADKPPDWWCPPDGWFWEGYRVDDRKARIYDASYVISFRGILDGVMLDIYIDPTGQRFSRDRMVCLDTYNEQIVAQCLNGQKVVHPVSREVADAVRDVFDRNLVFVAPEPNRPASEMRAYLETEAQWMREVLEEHDGRPGIV